MTNDWVDPEGEDIDDHAMIECDGCGYVHPYSSLYLCADGYYCLGCFDEYLYYHPESCYDY